MTNSCSIYDNSCGNNPWPILVKKKYMGMVFMILHNDFPAKIQQFIKNRKSFLKFQCSCHYFSWRNTRKRPASNIGRRALFVRLPRQPPFTNNQSFI